MIAIPIKDAGVGRYWVFNMLHPHIEPVLCEIYESMHDRTLYMNTMNMLKRQPLSDLIPELMLLPVRMPHISEVEIANPQLG